jgi:hypothetical protein
LYWTWGKGGDKDKDKDKDADKAMRRLGPPNGLVGSL